MCTPNLPKTGLQVPIVYEHRDALGNHKNAGVQLATSVDRRTGMRYVVNDEGHNIKGLWGTGMQVHHERGSHHLTGFKGTGAQSIVTDEGRDLANTRGTGVQLAGGNK